MFACVYRESVLLFGVGSKTTASFWYPTAFSATGLPKLVGHPSTHSFWNKKSKGNPGKQKAKGTNFPVGGNKMLYWSLMISAKRHVGKGSN